MKRRIDGITREITILIIDKISTIDCKIRGVRTVTGSDATTSYSDEWTRMVI